ncbi:MAG TPA: ABC transporter substrate-binding protein [Acidimicrobiia bacterium]|nr:ABC transporter substrate-binding protein [Acidimicrobiia bacterium]
MIALLVLALVAAACGDDDDAGTTQATTATTAAATTTTAAATTTTAGTTETTAAATTTTEAMTTEVPSSPDDGVTDDVIKIGWMGDLTGPTAGTQAYTAAGAAAYAAFVNANGGLAGREIELIEKDDQYSVETGTTNYFALVEDDKVLAISGQGGSGIIAAIKEDIRDSNVPFVAPQQTTDDQFDVPNFTNVLAHYGDQADIVVGIAADEVGGCESLVMASVGLEVASGEEWAIYIKDTVEKCGGTYTGHVRMPLTGSDADAQVLELKGWVDSEGLNYIASHGSPSAALRLINSMEAQGLDLPIGTIFAQIAENIYLEGSAEITDRYWGVHTYTPSNISTPGNDEMNAFVASSGNSRFTENVFNVNFVVGWVGMKITVEAARQTIARDGTLTRDGMLLTLDNLQFDTGGQTPALDCTNPGNACGAAARRYQWDFDTMQLEAVGTYADAAVFLDYTYGLGGN